MLVMRGSFKKKRATVSIIDLTRTRVALENIQRTKKDGTKVNVWFDPSSVQIQTLALDDKKRIAVLSRGKSKMSEKKENVKAGEENASNKISSK